MLSLVILILMGGLIFQYGIRMTEWGFIRYTEFLYTNQELIGLLKYSQVVVMSL